MTSQSRDRVVEIQPRREIPISRPRVTPWEHLAVDAVIGDWTASWPFVVGWIVGWLLLARPTTLPAAPSGLRRPPISVVVPARDEGATIPQLLRRLTPQLGADDELIVVDDGSSDDTADVGSAHGATVIRAATPTTGWLGKPHACWTGAQAASGRVLVFLDADVRPEPDLLDRLTARVRTGALVSVQPWHEPGSWSEHLSLFGNVAALAACGNFSVLGRRRSTPLAFGPVIALERATYRRIGGHGHPEVRSATAEDVALARLVDDVELRTGRGSVTFRMYPGGGRAMWNGWTRTIAAGAVRAPLWSTVGTVAWLWALGAAPFVGALAYVLAALQVGLVARIAGRFSPIVAICYPIPLLAFVAVTIRGLITTALGRSIDWRGRRVRAG